MVKKYKFMNREFNRRKKQDEFDSKLVDLARVVRVTAGGRRFRFRATIVIGDKKGKVGVGVAKGKDVKEAIEKAIVKAKKSLIELSLQKGTIPFEVEIKYQSAKILLKPQKRGKGIIAGGVIRTICELVGIKNITTKLLSRTNNKINIARATILALQELKTIEQK